MIILAACSSNIPALAQRLVVPASVAMIVALQSGGVIIVILVPQLHPDDLIAFWEIEIIEVGSVLARMIEEGNTVLP